MKNKEDINDLYELKAHFKTTITCSPHPPTKVKTCRPGTTTLDQVLNSKFQFPTGLKTLKSTIIRGFKVSSQPQPLETHTPDVCDTSMTNQNAGPMMGRNLY